MINAPWYIRNNDLHRDLLVDVVTSKIQRFVQKHKRRLHQNENVKAIQLLGQHGHHVQTPEKITL
jgi:ribosome-associated translation inhibitor RaiA